MLQKYTTIHKNITYVPSYKNMLNFQESGIKYTSLFESAGMTENMERAQNSSARWANAAIVFKGKDADKKIKEALEKGEADCECPRVFNKSNKEDFAMELLRGIKLAAKGGKKFKYKFEKADTLDIGSLELPNKKRLEGLVIYIYEKGEITIDPKDNRIDTTSRWLAGNDVELKFLADIKNPSPEEKLRRNRSIHLIIKTKESSHNLLMEYLFNVKAPVVSGVSDKFKNIMLSNVPYVRQYDSVIYEYTGQPASCPCKFEASTSSGNTCCFYTSRYMLEQSGATLNGQRRYLSVLNDATDLSKGVSPVDGNIDVAVDYICSTLKSGYPIVIGVHYSSSKSRLPYNSYLDGSKTSPTRHFMIAVGMGYDDVEKKNYIRFYDPGRSASSGGTASTNKLFIDIKEKRIFSNYQGATYTLTEVRLNN